jgi:hypothetical protein
MKELQVMYEMTVTNNVRCRMHDVIVKQLLILVS